MKNIAIILASGTGSRTGFELPKQFHKIKNKTILEWSVEAFEKNIHINNIILVVHSDFMDLTKDILKQNNYKKISKVITGGKERIDSSREGVFAVEEDEANVLIHDCVRPFVTQKIINDCITALDKYDAVDTAIDVVDTIFTCKDGLMQQIPPRKTLKKSQTPQCFKLSLIKKAHIMAQKAANIEFTDDCGLILQFNLAPIFIVDGDKNNIKITYKDDLRIAEIF